jgi:hypothetical protein
MHNVVSTRTPAPPCTCASATRNLPSSPLQAMRALVAVASSRSASMPPSPKDAKTPSRRRRQKPPIQIGGDPTRAAKCCQLELLEKCTVAGDFEGAEKSLRILRRQKENESKKHAAEIRHKRLCRLEADLHARLKEVARKKQECVVLMKRQECAIMNCLGNESQETSRTEVNGDEPLSPVSTATLLISASNGNRS